MWVCWVVWDRTSIFRIPSYSRNLRYLVILLYLFFVMSKPNGDILRGLLSSREISVLCKLNMLARHLPSHHNRCSHRPSHHPPIDRHLVPRQSHLHYLVLSLTLRGYVHVHLIPESSFAFNISRDESLAYNLWH
jgi:hypothetical protein